MELATACIPEGDQDLVHVCCEVSVNFFHYFFLVITQTVALADRFTHRLKLSEGETDLDINLI